MPKRNRKTLADHFADGSMPTQEAFADLIDSTVNIVDDGFDKSAEDGLKLAQLGKDGKLISFYDEITVRDPLWSVSFTATGYGGGMGVLKNLNFHCGGDGDGGLTLAPRMLAEQQETGPESIRVGINKRDPSCELDVNGVIAADGRLGRAGRKECEVRADGNWHPVLVNLDGCQAYEIMAGVGKPRSGRYALLHAFALSTFNSKKGNITSHQAHFSSRCDQIELRWNGSTHDYALEMRTRCSYEQDVSEKIYVRYYITQLWFDPHMEDCAGPSEAGAEA